MRMSRALIPHRGALRRAAAFMFVEGYGVLHLSAGLQLLGLLNIGMYLVGLGLAVLFWLSLIWRRWRMWRRLRAEDGVISLSRRILRITTSPK